MAFWSGEKLKSEINLGNLGSDLKDYMVECAGCILSIGREIYITESNPHLYEIGSEKRILKDREAFRIPPGQFGFILTQEEIQIPDSAMGFITLRATNKFHGLVNVSGFHVDPGYKGKLIFSVYNAGPASIHAQQGDDIFILFLTNLTEETQLIYDKPGHSDIPSKLINSISGRVVSPISVKKDLTKMELKFASIEERMATITALFLALIVAFFSMIIVDFNKSNSTLENEIRTVVSQPSKGEEYIVYDDKCNVSWKCLE